MNQTFNWGRFGKLLKSDALNLWPNFGLSFVILSLLPMAAWLFCLMLGKQCPDNVAPEIRWSLILSMSVLASLLAPSRLYKHCNTRNNGIYFAMLPASKLEKFLSMLLFCVVVAPLSVLLGGMVTDMVMYLLPFGPYNQSLFVHGHWIDYDVINTATANLYDPFTIGLFYRPGYIICYLVLSYLANCATFIFTNTIFHKHKVISTVLWCWLISFALQLVTTPLSLHYLNSTKEWFLQILENGQPLSLFNMCFGLIIAFTAVYTLVLTWWSAHRLKKMSY